jgi:hypothetical protein
MNACALCDEPIVDGATGMSELAHRECLLRSVIGGIGHLEDHAHWCLDMGDPDGGRTYRQSALEVDVWIAQHGMP